MARLIDADALRTNINNVPMHGDHRVFYDIMSELVSVVAAAPTIDTERHARWEAVNEHCNHAAVFRCSGRDGCGASVDYGHYTRFCDYEWCPNCGARMDAEGEKDG